MYIRALLWSLVVKMYHTYKVPKLRVWTCEQNPSNISTTSLHFFLNKSETFSDIRTSQPESGPILSWSSLEDILKNASKYSINYKKSMKFGTESVDNIRWDSFKFWWFREKKEHKLKTNVWPGAHLRGFPLKFLVLFLNLFLNNSFNYFKTTFMSIKLTYLTLLLNQDVRWNQNKNIIQFSLFFF